jgi:hypothetical protein
MKIYYHHQGAESELKLRPRLQQSERMKGQNIPTYDAQRQLFSAQAIQSSH